MKGLALRWISLMGVASLSAVLPAHAEGPEVPRYLFFNMAPGLQWRQDDPGSFSPREFEQVRDMLAVEDNDALRIGVSFVFSVLETPPDTLAESLRALLRASEASGVPVLVMFDGQNWWEHRPDLWNWWDPSAPGYDPANASNVEWTDWDASSAVQIGWRNWGRQIRVAPAQNIASPRVREETCSRMRPLAEIVAQWYRALPGDRNFLFGGLKVGWEASIGYNAYYYPGGNRLRETCPDDASHDPTTGLDPSKGPSGGLAQLGYAAVRTAGIKSKGQLTRDDLGEVVRRYLATLARVAADAGIPPGKVFTHQGGTYEPWNLHLSFRAACNAWSTPGWSFYGVDPSRAGDLPEVLGTSATGRWAAAEWWWGAADAAGWRDHFERTLRFRDCRFICVYNWNQGGFEKQPAGQQAVRELVTEWGRGSTRRPPK